jgi:membrane protein
MGASQTCGGHFHDWKKLFSRTLHGISNNHVDLYAAGIAFYMLLSLFPALGALTWLLGLLIDPSAIKHIPGYLHDVVPAEAIDLIQNQLTALTAKTGAGLSIVGIANAAIALFTARNAEASMIEALNTIYKVEDTRTFVKLNAIAIMFTAVAICAMVLAIFLILIAPAVLALMSPDNAAGRLLRLLRWPMLALFAALALSCVYYYGPNRPKLRWRWFTWGSVTATAIWLAASFGFSWYVAEFNSYNRVYGSLGAVVILLFWFWLTAFAGLAGAQLDKEISERAQWPSRSDHDPA